MEKHQETRKRPVGAMTAFLPAFGLMGMAVQWLTGYLCVPRAMSIEDREEKRAEFLDKVRQKEVDLERQIDETDALAATIWLNGRETGQAAQAKERIARLVVRKRVLSAALRTAQRIDVQLQTALDTVDARQCAAELTDIAKEASQLMPQLKEGSATIDKMAVQLDKMEEMGSNLTDFNADLTAALEQYVEGFTSATEEETEEYIQNLARGKTPPQQAVADVAPSFPTVPVMQPIQSPVRRGCERRQPAFA